MKECKEHIKRRGRRKKKRKKRRSRRRTQAQVLDASNSRCFFFLSTPCTFLAFVLAFVLSFFLSSYSGSKKRKPWRRTDGPPTAGLDLSLRQTDRRSTLMSSRALLWRRLMRDSTSKLTRAPVGVCKSGHVRPPRSQTQTRRKT